MRESAVTRGGLGEPANAARVAVATAGSVAGRAEQGPGSSAFAAVLNNLHRCPGERSNWGNGPAAPARTSHRNQE